MGLQKPVDDVFLLLSVVPVTLEIGAGRDAVLVVVVVNWSLLQPSQALNFSAAHSQIEPSYFCPYLDTHHSSGITHYEFGSFIGQLFTFTAAVFNCSVNLDFKIKIKLLIYHTRLHIDN